jgi:hypothetical protein
MTMLQFGRDQQPVRTNPRLSLTPKEQGVMGKLARIVMGVFEAQHSHVSAKRCYMPKISKGGFIKVTIGLTELMRQGDPVRYLFGEPKEWNDLQFGSKEFKAVPRL